MRAKAILWATCFLAATLVGCGSDSSSGGVATMNGKFVDAQVEGLAYSCGGTTGFTGTDGTFTCPVDSTVTFSVGAVTICSQVVQAFVTPISCAQATDPTANAASPEVVAVTRFLMSISSTPADSGTLTITPAMRQAAANVTLDLATATDQDLQSAVDTINPGSTLADATTAQNEITNVVNTQYAGNYSGTWIGTAGGVSASGNWQITIDQYGEVSGTADDGHGGTVTVAGNLTLGTTFTGTAGNATWTGNLDTSTTPAGFSGAWQNTGQGSGTFTGGHN